jgi:hypothetical protein
MLGRPSFWLDRAPVVDESAGQGASQDVSKKTGREPISSRKNGKIFGVLSQSPPGRFLLAMGRTVQTSTPVVSADDLRRMLTLLCLSKAFRIGLDGAEAAINDSLA